MDRTLIIYDLTGRVLSIIYGAAEAPQGVPYVWCDVPPGAIVDHVDTTTGQVVFEYEPESDLGRMQANIAAMQQTVNDIQMIANQAAGMVSNIEQMQTTINGMKEITDNVDVMNQNVNEVRATLTSIEATAGDALSTAQLAVQNASAANELAETNERGIDDLQTTVDQNAANTSEMVGAANNDITAIQEALAEVYEMLIGEEN